MLCTSDDEEEQPQTAPELGSPGISLSPSPEFDVRVLEERARKRKLEIDGERKKEERLKRAREQKELLMARFRADKEL